MVVFGASNDEVNTNGAEPMISFPARSNIPPGRFTITTPSLTGLQVSSISVDDNTVITGEAQFVRLKLLNRLDKEDVLMSSLKLTKKLSEFSLTIEPFVNDEVIV